MERKPVKVIIKSTQHDIENTPVESSYTGHYAYKNGMHLLSYEEAFESGPTDAVVKNLYKISDRTLQLTKSGAISSKMLFDTEKRHQNVYKTPFGSFALLLHTKCVSIDASEEALTVFLNYDLFLNQNFISNCTIEMTVLFGLLLS